ncbi:MAG: 50S ribosomal protein L4 [Bacteroidota bacterium]
MVLPVITYQGKKTGRKIELSPDVFGLKPNNHVVYLDVKRIRAQQRQGTHKTKERGEVRGSTRKIQKQKGTGNARKGARNSPILRGGGRTFGPEPRDYGIKINKKTQRLARRVALSDMARKQSILVLEHFSFDTPKTKQYQDMLEKLGSQEEKTVLVLPKADHNIILSARNIPKAKVITPEELNTYAILNTTRLLLSEKAVALIQEQLC